jgi:PAS domain S-box-containing protein
LDAFAGELAGESAGGFLLALDKVLRQVTAAGGDVADWHTVLSVLRRHVLPCLGSAQALRAEDLWQQARVMIGETAKRVEMHQAWRETQQARLFGEIEGTLITTFDVTRLMGVLVDRLPRLGIPSCYISLYENPEAPATWARLILAYNEQGRAALGGDGWRFPSQHLVPGGLFTRERPYNLVVEPLYFEETQLGFAVFEVGSRDGDIYEVLRRELSSALQGALLMQSREEARKALAQAYAGVEEQVKQRTAELQQEIVERRQVQEALAEERNLLRTLIDNVPDLIYVKDIQSRFVLANSADVRFMGASSPDELIGKTDFDFYPQQLAAQFYADEQAIVESGQPLISKDEPNLDHTGTRRWLLTTKVPLRDNEGKIVGIVGVGRDVTARRQAEEALQQRARELATLNALGQRVNATISLDQVVQAAIEGAISATQCDLALFFLREGDELVLQGVGPGASPFGAQETPIHRVGECLCGLVVSTGKAVFSNDVLGDSRCTREECWKAGFHSFAALPLYSGDEIVGVLGLASAAERDFGEQSTFLETIAHQIAAASQNALLHKQAQDHAAELERRVIERTAQLESANKELEAFAYSVSHDLRAPLRAIDGYTRILAEDHEPFLGAEGQRLCAVVRDETHRMGQLIDDLLALSRLSRADMQPFPIDMEALAEAVFRQLTTPASRARIDFRVANLPPAVGDPTLVRQVWLNLLSNAIKFSSKQERALVEVGTRQSEGETIYYVRDNGAGFDMQFAGKLFGVFQRLHSEREFEGTGVGLAIVQRAIYRHGGRVWGEGEVGKGATFFFTLPHGGD